MPNKAKRGRPSAPLKLPRTEKMTINDIAEVNPQFRSRLTLYRKVNDLIADRVLRKTGRTTPSDGVNNVGKPGKVFQRVSAWKRDQARKQPVTLVEPAPVEIDAVTA